MTRAAPQNLASTLPTPSPCVSLCKINQDTGLCEGCWRSIDEIIAWGTASEAIKQEIWKKIQQRKPPIDETAHRHQ